jgi:hypothetical protein
MAAPKHVAASNSPSVDLNLQKSKAFQVVVIYDSHFFAFTSDLQGVERLEFRVIVFHKSFSIRSSAMSHYQDRHELFDGNVVVFRRGDAISQRDKRIWQARFKLDGLVGFKTLSMKTRNQIDAIAKAKSKYLQLTQGVRDGASLSSRTFERAWRDWYSFMVVEGVWSASRQKWHLNYFERYFRAYFGAKKLDEITNEFANSYWNWRRRYWVDGEGVNQISYNRRRRSMKSHLDRKRIPKTVYIICSSPTYPS